MNLTHLRYALEIAKTRSISRAAENLFMGQPNLSRAIRELEESLGITIFRRTSKGITITDEGEQFLQHAQRIIQQVDELEQAYRTGGPKRQLFSVSAPRASYIAQALASFLRAQVAGAPLDAWYQETNAGGTIASVTSGSCNLGIVRYRLDFEPQFRALFREKNLLSETVADFSYRLLLAQTHPLAHKPDLRLADLQGYAESAHADPYVPSMPLPDLRRQALEQVTDRHIYVFERSSQFELLEQVPGAFMWVSAVPPALLQKYGLVQREVAENRAPHRDVLIRRKNYSLTELDQAFLTALCEAKRLYLDAPEPAT